MIGPARREDVHEVLPLMLAAIGNIAYTLAGTEDQAEAERILAGFYTREDNRISYKHVLVDRREEGIAGMLISYAGDGAAALDVPFVTRPGRDKGPRSNESIAVEAEAGEYYLDSIAVDERFQGQGIAKTLIGAFEQRGLEEGYNKLSLIVEPYNTRARALYKKLDFTEDGSIEVSGSEYIRMVKHI
ncbi:GNAT family N-acetyltransferase [Paenibacillus sp. FJAT-27812]|uniref:GNAT family N-acetyltransferase n=1 Tax=Paenibacillus sp. FJAT-27812 TaxID=1684143 RepID=UPI0006A78B88|nr:GNAT family N-acetyltransferase [Paenibacillus sp. FJAT-27812]